MTTTTFSNFNMTDIYDKVNYLAFGFYLIPAKIHLS